MERSPRVPWTSPGGPTGLSPTPNRQDSRRRVPLSALWLVTKVTWLQRAVTPVSSSIAFHFGTAEENEFHPGFAGVFACFLILRGKRMEL